MGQQIQVSTKTVIDEIAMLSTDRGVTGQDGVSLFRGDEVGDGFPSALAGEILAADEGIEHVFVVSNQVVARCPDGWDDALLDEIAGVITRFFVFYDES